LRAVVKGTAGSEGRQRHAGMGSMPVVAGSRAVATGRRGAAVMHAGFLFLLPAKAVQRGGNRNGGKGGARSVEGR